MISYYLIKIEYQHEDDTGRFKVVKESYLFDAQSFTEAEGKGYDVLDLYTPVDFTVISITPISFYEVIKQEDCDNGNFYKSRLAYESVNDKTGNVKKVKIDLLIKAEDFDNAIHTLKIQVLDKWLVDMEIEAVMLTPILEFFEN